MRILHLIDPGSVEVGAEALAMIADAVKRLPQHTHDVLIVASGQWTIIARRIGLKPIGSITPTNGRPILARRALRNVISRNESVYGRYDVLHAWTLSCAALASCAAPDHQIVTGPVFAEPKTSKLSRQEIKRLNRSAARVLCATKEIKQECVSLGIDELLLCETSLGVDSDRIVAENRKLLRDSWGVDETTFVVGSLGNAQVALRATTLVEQTNRNIRLIVHPHAQLRFQATLWARRLGGDEKIIIENQYSQLWNIASGLDAAIVNTAQCNAINRSSQPNNLLSVLWLMASGTPTIINSEHRASTFISDEKNGLLFPSSDINAINQGLMRLIDEPKLAQQIRSASTKFVADQFGAKKLAENLADIYQQTSRGQRVRISTTDADVKPPETVKLVSNSAKNTSAILVKSS